MCLDRHSGRNCERDAALVSSYLGDRANRLPACRTGSSLQLSPAQSCATGVLFPTGQLGSMNDGIEAFRSQLQKELGLLIGPKDPLLALWVSQRELLEQNAAQQQKLLSEFQAAQESNRLVRAGESARTAELKRRATGCSK